MLHADATGVTVEWRAPAASWRQVMGDDGCSYVALDAPGWAQTDVVGQPQLPLASALLVAPPTGEVTLNVQVLEQERISLSAPVAPAPRMAALGDPPIDLGPTWARDERAYAGSGLPTAEVVVLEEAGQMRGRRLVRLTFSPLRFDPAGPAVEAALRVRVKLAFEDAGAVEATGWTKDDIFTPILQQVVVNPEQAVQFARQERAAHTSGTVAPASTLADPPGGADYLIIAHEDFISAVTPLAAHRASSDGLRVYSTTVQAIYDEYGDGSVNAANIRDYIDHAYHNWVTPTLSYVLLVGDGVESGSEGQYIPPYTITMKAGDPSWWGSDWEEQAVASDNRFVAVDGSDRLPDISIGRLPVNSVPETRVIMDKILDYDLNPPQYPWNERALFFAGNEDEGSGDDFHADANDIYNCHLPDILTGRRVYFCTQDCAQSYKYEDITTAQDVTMAMLNGGGLLASYVGHSSWHQWVCAPQNCDPMFHMDDISSLHNGGALPVFLEMTCYTSRFSDPDGATLDENLLRHEGGGAIATWGSTALGRTGGHRILHQRFFYAVFQDDTIELGPAIQFAKSGLIGDDDSDLIDTFVLLGDPAMNLNMTIVPWTDQIFLPLVMRGG